MQHSVFLIGLNRCQVMSVTISPTNWSQLTTVVWLYCVVLYNSCCVVVLCCTVQQLLCVRVDRRHSPERSRSPAGPRRWCSGGPGSPWGAWSCRPPPAGRPCSPRWGLRLCTPVTCTRHSVPRLGSAAWQRGTRSSFPGPAAGPAPGGDAWRSVRWSMDVGGFWVSLTLISFLRVFPSLAPEMNNKKRLEIVWDMFFSPAWLFVSTSPSPGWSASQHRVHPAPTESRPSASDNPTSNWSCRGERGEGGRGCMPLVLCSGWKAEAVRLGDPHFPLDLVYPSFKR